MNTLPKGMPEGVANVVKTCAAQIRHAVRTHGYKNELAYLKEYLHVVKNPQGGWEIQNPSHSFAIVYDANKVWHLKNMQTDQNDGPPIDYNTAMDLARNWSEDTHLEPPPSVNEMKVKDLKKLIRGIVKEAYMPAPEGIVEYLGPMMGARPFVLDTAHEGQQKFEVCIGRLPNGKRGLAIYAYRGDFAITVDHFNEVYGDLLH